jgi:hypothetical protein
MKQVVSFSGGRTSAYLLSLFKDNKDAVFIFCDTGAEHPNTYEFIKQCVDYFDIDLICLRAVINQGKGIGVTYKQVSVDSIGWVLSMFADISKKYGGPFHPSGAHCTQHLKTIPFYKYCDDFYGKGNYVTWLGIRVDELKRLKPKKGVKYLAELSQMDKNGILGYWRDMPFDLDLDEWLGNCVFCIKKPINRVALATLSEPELAKEFNAMLEVNDSNEKHKGAIYRGKLTLNGVAKFFDGYDKEKILSTTRIRRDCGPEQGESCEVFGCQQDLFEDNES